MSTTLSVTLLTHDDGVQAVTAEVRDGTRLVKWADWSSDQRTKAAEAAALFLDCGERDTMEVYTRRGGNVRIFTGVGRGR